MSRHELDPVEARLDSLREHTEHLVAPNAFVSSLAQRVRRRAIDAQAWHREVLRIMWVSLTMASVTALVSSIAAAWYESRSLQMVVAASVLADDEP